MTKQKLNHDIWKLFVFIAERMNERSFLMDSVDEQGSPIIFHTGIGMDDMHVSIKPHAYLPMTHIDIDLNLPEEVTTYLAGDLVDGDAIKTRDWLNTRGPISYLIYNEMMPTVKKELEHLYQLVKGSDHPDLGNIFKMVEFLGNMVMSEMAPKVAKVANQYYPLAINRLPHVIVAETSDEWAEETFRDMTSGDAEKVGYMVLKAAKQISAQLRQMADLTNSWAGKTQEIKDYDLWLSLNIEDHKIILGLDRQPYRSEDTYTIERSPVNLEEWKGETDLEIIARLEEYVDQMNIIVGNLLNHNTGYEMLNKEIEQMYIQRVHHPIARHTVRVWEFDDVCEAGRTKVDEEISWILQEIERKSAEHEQPLKLDLSNMFLHGVKDGEAYILTQEHQSIAARCQTLSGAFFEAMIQHMFDVKSDLIGPFTQLKPADLSKEAISEEELLKTPQLKG